MKKKLFIGLGVLLVILVTSAITFAVSPAADDLVNKKHVPSDYKIGIPYEEAVKADKPMLALFYVDWCGYCLRFMPKFRTISDIYKDKYNVVMLNAEAPENQALVKDVALTGFPTLYVIDKKYDNRFLLNNAIYMDLKKLRVELDRYLKVRKQLDAAADCSCEK